MSYPLPLTRTEAYLAYKAGIIQQSELKPSLSVPIIGIDAWLAYWTGLKDEYPKNPDGTPKMLQEEEKYIAYLCGVTDKYPEKCLRRVGAYLRYIISARWGRPDHPLNREELYLSIIKTQFIPSGDPSSDIVIDGTAKAAFVDIKMYGDTFQQSYVGKNILNYIDNLSSGHSGITNTLNPDGTITSQGKPTANYVPVSKRYDITNALEDGATYTLSSTSYSGKVFAQVRRKNISDGKTFNWDTIEQERNFTVDKGQYEYSVAIMTNSLASWGNETLTITQGYQIEKSSTATSFEPYVGGAPSPNPDYPQPIQVVTGRQTVTVTGKNLFDGGVTHEFIMPGGIVSDNDDWNLSGYIKVSPNTAYTFSYKQSSEPLHTVMISEFNANNGFIIRNRYEGSSHYTFTTSSTTEFIRLNYLNISNDTDFQIELGSTASLYEPYTSTDYHLDLGTIELCKLGDYQDYIWKDQDQWKIHNAIDKNIFFGDGDGNSYAGSSTGTNTVRALIKRKTLSTPAYRNVTEESYSLYSDNFIEQKNAGDKESLYVVHSAQTSYGWNGDMRIYIDKSRTESYDGNDVEKIKAWLKDHPTKIYNILVTATDTSITNQALIDQLEALVKGGSEDGTTYIKVSATEPDLPAKLYVEAPKYTE